MSSPLPADTPAADIGELVQWVASTGVHPIDAFHVAAMLEMNGWTDYRAVSLGYEDVFALAETIHAALRTTRYREPGVQEEKVPWYKVIFRTVMLYLRGLVFAAPMVLSSFSVIAIGYSLWSYVGFSTEIATGIALGTFGSFLVAGGFTQAIARRGLFYLSQYQYDLARRASLQLLMVGLAVALVNAVLLAVLMVLIPILPWAILRVAWFYYVVLTITWLGTGLLYMLQKELIVLALVAGGIGLVYVQHELYGVEMMTAQWWAMGAIALGTVIAAIVTMSRLVAAKDTDARIHGVMPRWSQVSRSLSPYFMYGTVYFALLYTDRILAWSKPETFHPYVIWFLGDYELGLDWALWTLVLPMGLVEIYIHALFRRMSRRQRVFTIDKVTQFNRSFRRDHTLLSGLVLLASALSMILIIVVINFLQRIGALPVDPLEQEITRFVFYIAAPAYSLVTVGLQNALVLFSLNDPWPAVRACSWSLVGDLIVGFLGSRYGGHQWAVLGLLTGAILFAVLSTRAVFHVLDHLDLSLMRSV